MNKQAHIWGWLLLLVTAIWGVGFVVSHNSLQIIGPHTINGLRFMVAVLTIASYLILSNNWSKLKWSKQSIHHGVALGGLLFAAFATQTIGLQFTSTANTGFITGLNVVFVPFIAWLWLKQRLKWQVWLGVGLATVGLLLLTGGVSGFGIGETLVLVCAFFFALHIVYTGVYVQQCDALVLTLVQLAVVAVISLIAAAIYEVESLQRMPQLVMQFNSDIWLTIFVSGVLGSGVAYVVQTLSQQYLESWRVALIYSTEPVFAAIAGVMLLNEVLGMWGLIGGIFVLVGMLIAELME
ncbi:DMT family transporter [Paraferrimonas sp. SM1919]|uniref:DMT family transporter n=1 Tax=Paraferrimonas sp. SM1919 TaxID=2662263 RepID=UPI0013D804BD|nr:DMT family transporter [Paraferrimonas sp. SM1919]